MEHHLLRQYPYAPEPIIRWVIADAYYRLFVVRYITYLVVELNGLSATHRGEWLIVYRCGAARLKGKTLSIFLIDSPTIETIKGHICPIASNRALRDLIDYVLLVGLGVAPIGGIHIENRTACRWIGSTIVDDKVPCLLVTE